MTGPQMWSCCGDSCMEKCQGNLATLLNLNLSADESDVECEFECLATVESDVEYEFECLVAVESDVGPE